MSNNQAFHFLLQKEPLKPICRGELDFPSYAGENVTILGWGRTEENAPIVACKLLEAELAVRYLSSLKTLVGRYGEQ